MPVPLLQIIGAAILVPLAVASSRPPQADSCPIQFAKILSKSGLQSGSHKLDEATVSEIELIRNSLAPDLRARFDKAIVRIEWKDYMGEARGAVTRGLRPSIQIASDLSRHPQALLTLIHEADHLSRAIQPLRMAIGLAKKTGLLEEETKAFKREYTFIKKVYSLTDLSRLEQEFPSAFPRPGEPLYDQAIGDIALLKKFKIYTPKDLRRVSGLPEVQAAFARRLLSSTNALFKAEVRDALTLSQDEYVKERLEAYQATQVFLDAVRILRNGFFTAVIPGVAAYKAWDTFSSKASTSNPNP